MEAHDYVRDLLSTYYTRANLYLPKDFMLREFAFQLYGRRVYVRHLSFQSIAALREYLVRNTPLQAYYSSALYRDPAAERMEDKGWLGSEIMFDIDSDHIEGCTPQVISTNGSGGLKEEVKVVTPKCIELSKEHVLRLLDILHDEFGFSSSEVVTYFTGNRGFHIIVRPRDSEWLRISSIHRRELVDYIKGTGLDIKRLLPSLKAKGIKVREFKPSNGGWRGRLAKAGVGIDGLRSGVDLTRKCGVEIDEQVTQDISRLIRIPGSINGKSGLPALLLSEGGLASFRLGTHLSPFNGSAIVIPYVDIPKDIVILGKRLNMRYKRGYKARIELPIALLLALNNIARIVDLY